MYVFLTALSRRTVALLRYFETLWLHSTPNTRPFLNLFNNFYIINLQCTTYYEKWIFMKHAFCLIYCIRPWIGYRLSRACHTSFVHIYGGGGFNLLESDLKVLLVCFTQTYRWTDYGVNFVHRFLHRFYIVFLHRFFFTSF